MRLFYFIYKAIPKGVVIMLLCLFVGVCETLAQNIQDAQETQNVQNAQNIQDTQNAPETQDVQNAQEMQDVQDAPETQDTQNAQETQDVQQELDEMQALDSLAQPEQPKKRSAIDAIVRYEAKDSVVLQGNGTAYLHGSGKLNYQRLELTSEQIRVKMDSSTIYAKGVYDEQTGEWKGLPVFKDGTDSYASNEISYNIKTQKGYIRHVVSEQGEGYIISEKTKKVEGDILMMADGIYTTCDDHDHPHFGMKITKGKVKPGEYIASGPAYLVVGDVPLPLAIPFGFFPFTNKYSSGLIMPTFGDEATRGLYLQGLGYYFAINDYVDLMVKGDIYTKGTWAISAQSKYIKRYKFRGNVNVNYRSDVFGEKGMPDYSKNNSFSIAWTHTQDTKANPYCNFSASVNFKTAGYTRNNINNYYNPQANSESTTSSSINYTQRFPDSPWNMSVSANITQNMRDSTLSLTLPNINVSMSRVFPFKRKNPVGKERWYEKISLSYTGAITNSVTCKEDYLLHSDFVRDWRNGVKHSLPVNANFTLFKYINISPNISYNESWVFRRIDQSWNEQENQVQRDTTNGFYRLYDLSMGVSMSTKLYGFYTPIRKIFKQGKVDRFRHVLTPTISFSYRPDFEPLRSKYDRNYYASYMKPVVDKQTGDTIWEEVNYNRFQGGAYSAPGQGQSGSLNWSLGNNLEMKIRNDKDTTGKEPYKVISLIDQLQISGSYNFLADSMQLSNFRVQLRLKLPLNYTLNLSGEFDPYMYGLTASGTPKRINKFYWSEGRFPHFLGTSTSFSYTFTNQTFRKLFNREDKKKKSETATPELESQIDPLTGEIIPPEPTQERKRKTRDESPAETDGDYQKVDIPWSLSVNYTIRYGSGSQFDYDKMYYKMEWTHNLSLSGTLSLGKGWRVSANTSYDFKAKKFAYTSFNVSRDLHCWSMSCSFVPFGVYKSYNFHIGVNASMLADLKYDKSSADSMNKRVDWW